MATQYPNYTWRKECWATKLEHTQTIWHLCYFERFPNHFLFPSHVSHVHPTHFMCVFLRVLMKESFIQTSSIVTNECNTELGRMKLLPHYVPQTLTLFAHTPHCQHAFNVASKEDLGFTSHVRELGRCFEVHFCTLGFYWWSSHVACWVDALAHTHIGCFVNNSYHC